MKNRDRINLSFLQPYIINAIKISRLLEKEVLVTVAENGEVCIYRTDNLQEPPMIIK